MNPETNRPQTLEQSLVPGLMAAYDLGSRGHLSEGPVASGRLGSIWRLDTDVGSWAVKLVEGTSRRDLVEVLEGASFQEAARAAGVPTPEVRRARTGELIADVGGIDVRVHAWADLEAPDTGLDAAKLGRLVAGLHRVTFAGSVGLDPWYEEPVGALQWASLVASLRARHAPFADELAAVMPGIVALEGWLGGPPRAMRTCHRDLWADNLRQTPGGDLCVFDFDNAGFADPSQELAAVLVEYASADPARARLVRASYEEAGGPGRVERPEDFAMPIAQLHHIVEAGCRRWLLAESDAGRADNEAWVREYLVRPLTQRTIDVLLGE